jgi:hypothetical protein
MTEKSSSKGEGGSWLYGLLLIIAGAFIVLTGIMNVAGWNPIGPLLPPELQVLASTSGWMSIVIGAWGFVGGVGLIKDQEWGWGISLVVLSVVIVTYLIDVITVISLMPAVLPTIIQWIEIGAVVVCAIGIVYLLLTKYKYA